MEVSDGAPGNGVLKRDFVITNQYGIHARPAAMIVKAASRFDADFTVEKDGNRVSGKSIMGLMTLEASRGSRISVTVEGPDGQALLDELQRLFEAGFDEE